MEATRTLPNSSQLLSLHGFYLWMRNLLFATFTSLLLAGTTLFGATTGDKAPEFTLPGADGETYSLSDFEGKYVVLEWLNHDCPAVIKFYEPGEMQRLQAELAEKDVVWLSIISSAPGTQGHCTPEEATALTKEKEAKPAAVLLDPDGTVGRAYQARTTPHMYVINPEGELIYNGAVDANRSTRVSDAGTAEYYFLTALEDSWAGREISRPMTRAYGCSIKYAR